jgi:ABC-type lipoprotein export system ATPase subunit
LSSRSLVRLEDVRFAYPGGDFCLAVDDFEVAEGERVACIGPSGSGKTTLVNLITGIEVPDAGRARLGDVELARLSDAERRSLRIAEVGLVFQELELLEYLSALDNVLLPYYVSEHLALDAAARSRARELADSTGIAHALGRKPRGLSQGERQRVAICRALVTAPRLVCCDEPTGNLDPRTSASVLDLLFREASASGAALFVVTHNHSILDRFDRVVDATELSA